MPASWLSQIPALSAMAAEVGQVLTSQSKVVSLPPEMRVYAPGRAPEAYLLVLDGSVRVQQVSESGREIVLYRVTAGESCTLTTACLLGHDTYSAEAVTETPVKAVAIPRATFDDLVARSPEFRRFVFTAFSDRITNLFRLVEQVAFGRLDARLARKLVDLADETGLVVATQQQLAAEIGSAREVISRVLGDFSRRGWLTVQRGRIRLVDHAALTACGAGA